MIGRLKNVRLQNVIFATLMLIGCWFVIDYFGVPKSFCYAEMRVLSDGEFIQKALTIVKEDIKFEPNDSVKNYYHNHPDCCYVNKISEDLIINSLSSNRVTVMMKYEVKKPSSTRGKYFTGPFQFNSCGQLTFRTGETDDT